MDNQSNNIASTKLYNLFLAYKARPFIFVERKGNFGDYLIWKGAEKLAKVTGITYRAVEFNEFLKNNYSADSVIYIHGGGGSNSFWTNNGVMDSLSKAITTHQGVVILGPETFSVENDSFKERLKASFEHSKAEKVFIFTRDESSYRFLRNSLPEGVTLELDHDTALNLDVSDLGKINLSAKYTFYAVREDKEAVDIFVKDFFSVWLDPILHCRDFSEWLKIHSQAKEIITNRLHSAILGTILGKKTTLLPNSYHKNRGVWEYSLKDKGVRWSEKVRVSRLNRLINAVSPLRRIVSSYKFRGTLQVFYGVR